MDDLISRSALLEELSKGTIIPDDMYSEGIMAGVDYAIKKIEAAPAVDAVEVVRCKDCKHRGDDICCPMCFEEESVIDEGDGYFDTDYITHDRTVDDGFCDRGERRDDDGD
jgi:hypothetical protein